MLLVAVCGRQRRPDQGRFDQAGQRDDWQWADLGATTGGVDRGVDADSFSAQIDGVQWEGAPLLIMAWKTSGGRQVLDKHK